MATPERLIPAKSAAIWQTPTISASLQLSRPDGPAGKPSELGFPGGPDRRRSGDLTLFSSETADFSICDMTGEFT